MKYLVASLMATCMMLLAFEPARAVGNRFNVAPVVRDASTAPVFTAETASSNVYIITIVLMIIVTIATGLVGYWLGYRRCGTIEYRLLRELREQYLEDNRES